MVPTFTLHDLRRQSLHQLHVLRYSLGCQLAAAAPGSSQARQIVAAMTVVDLAIRQRTLRGPRP